MFSYEIYNPNNFVIENDYYIIPFGHRCSSALACIHASLRKFSLPFDWGIFFPKVIKNILENNFTGFTDFTYLEAGGISNNIYGFTSGHFSSNHDENVETFERRINRFNYILNQPKKIYFVYINEDYLYNNNYREDKFNDKNFKEMLELENFIKNKYKNVDYYILYFNFKRHNIPVDSKIINIVLYSANFYDNENSSSFLEFRKYCGKILLELFNKKTLLSDFDDTYLTDLFSK